MKRTELAERFQPALHTLTDTAGQAASGAASAWRDRGAPAAKRMATTAREKAGPAATAAMHKAQPAASAALHKAQPVASAALHKAQPVASAALHKAQTGIGTVAGIAATRRVHELEAKAKGRRRRRMFLFAALAFLAGVAAGVAGGMMWRNSEHSEDHGEESYDEASLDGSYQTESARRPDEQHIER